MIKLKKEGKGTYQSVLAVKKIPVRSKIENRQGETHLVKKIALRTVCVMFPLYLQKDFANFASQPIIMGSATKSSPESRLSLGGALPLRSCPLLRLRLRLLLLLFGVVGRRLSLVFCWLWWVLCWWLWLWWWFFCALVRSCVCVDTVCCAVVSLRRVVPCCVVFFFEKKGKKNQTRAERERAMPAPHSARPACRWSHSTSHVVGDLPSPPWLWKRSSNDDATVFAAAHQHGAPTQPPRLLKPAFSSTALPLALEPWPIDSETLAFHWTIGHPLPPPELPTGLCCWDRPVLGTL